MPSIAFWQKKLSEIYPNAGKSPDYMMAHLYTACSDLGRALLRNETDDRADDAIIKAVSWMVALATHFKIDYQEALAHRFPCVCPYCLVAPCECDRTGKRARQSSHFLSAYEVQKELEAKYNSYLGIEKNFGWLLTQLSAIYPSNRAFLIRGGQSFITAKMLEEGGELHRAYSAYLLGLGGIDAISVELSDLTAWVVSCWDIKAAGISLDAQLASEFVNGCYLCHKAPCVCRTYSITMTQEELVRSFVEQLRALVAVGIRNPIIEDALKTAQDVATAPTPVAKRSLIDKARAVISALGATERGVESVQGIITHLNEVVQEFEHLV